MGRKKESKTQKLCWSFKVSYPDRNIVIIDKQYATLADIANETGLPYSKINDMKDGGRCKSKNKISFYPTIELKRIGAISNLIKEEEEEPVEEVVEQSN